MCQITIVETKEIAAIAGFGAAQRLCKSRITFKTAYSAGYPFNTSIPIIMVEQDHGLVAVGVQLIFPASTIPKKNSSPGQMLMPIFATAARYAQNLQPCRQVP